MGVLAKNNRQFTYIYSSTSSIGKQGKGYAESLGDKVQMLDISKTKLGDTIWVELAEKMGKDLKDLFSLRNPDASDVAGSDFSTEDWLKVLHKNPSILQNPILINGDNYLQITTPSKVLEFFSVDSAGLKKKTIGEKPTTSSTTKGQKFINRNSNDSNIENSE